MCTLETHNLFKVFIRRQSPAQSKQIECKKNITQFDEFLLHCDICMFIVLLLEKSKTI